MDRNGVQAGAMKEPHIDADVVELKFVGPLGKKVEAIQALQSLGFVNLGEALPWRLAFPEYDEKSLPGVVLAGARGKEGITQRELAGRVGLPQRHISEMERSKRPIGKEMAKKLGAALHIDYRALL
jgi:DNA-binding XRE family transcriptional regulator